MFYRAAGLVLFFSFSFMSSCAAVKNKVAAANYSRTTNALKPLVVLDPGHGGPDIGAKIKFPRVEEKRFTLQTALAAKRYLEQLGYRVVMTRTRDIFVPLKRRVYVANKANSEIFVSLHFNSCPNKEVQGIEIYYSDFGKNKNRAAASKKLADTILARMIFRSGAVSRGVKKGSFCVIRDTRMPSVLIEGGFVTHKGELSKIKQRQYLDKMAKGVAEGIDRFIRS